MCGIIWAKRFDDKDAKKTIRKRYQQQRSRGTQGFGFVETIDGCVYTAQRAMYEHDIQKKLDGSTAKDILFHHRFPTSTPNVDEATHPILVQNTEKLKYSYFVVHNGVISNALTLKHEFEKEGFAYNTFVKTTYVTALKTYDVAGENKFNDSESLAIDVAKMLDTMDSDKPHVLKSMGSIAFLALQFDTDTGKAIALYFARNTNPLKLDYQKERIILASEGHGEEVKAHTLYKFDYADEKVYELKPMTVGWGGSTYNPRLPATKDDIPGWRGYGLPDKKTEEDLIEEMGFHRPYKDKKTDEDYMREAEEYAEERVRRNIELDLEEQAEAQDDTDYPTIQVVIPETDGVSTYTREFETVTDFEGAYFELIDEQHRCKTEDLLPALERGDHAQAAIYREEMRLLGTEIKAYDKTFREVYADVERYRD